MARTPRAFGAVRGPRYHLLVSMCHQRAPSRLSQTIASYDRNAAAYAERFEGIDTADHLAWFARAMRTSGFGPGARVADLGCGSGRDARQLAGLGYSLTGLDISWGLLCQARMTAPTAGFVHGDMVALPFGDQTLQGVWMMAAMVHLSLPQSELVLAEVQRVLGPHGVVYLSVRQGQEPGWLPDGLGGKRWFHYHRTTEGVESLLLRGGLEPIEVELAPGIASGTWINALARKP